MAKTTSNRLAAYERRYRELARTGYILRQPHQALHHVWDGGLPLS